MNHLWLSRLVLVISIITALAFKINIAVSKNTITHDEGITFLSSTCHQGEYSKLSNGKYPSGKWVRAGEWKRFLKVEEKFCFEKIGRELALHDIHPPLYFWLLHLWFLVFGVTLWSGPAFNALLGTITAIFLYFLARDTLSRNEEVAAVVFLWVMSPQTIAMTFEARQYDLLALCAVIFAWGIVRYCNLKRPAAIRDYLLIIIPTTLGMLTHYHFALVVMSGCLFLFARLFTMNRKKLVHSLFALFAGCVGFLLLHPNFYLSFARANQQNQPFQFPELVARTKFVVLSFTEFFINVTKYAFLLKIMAVLLLLAVISISIWVVVKTTSNRFYLKQYISGINWKGIEILYFFVFTAGAIVALYLSFMSPRHAMSTKYLSMVWPFYAFLPVFIFRVFKRKRITALVILCIGIFLFGTLGVTTRFNNRNPGASHLLNSSNAIIIDTVARGIAPRILWHIPDDKDVFVANQNYILNNGNRWLNRSLSNALYISTLFPKSKKQTLEILNMIGKNHKATYINGGIWGLGHVFRIEKPTMRRGAGG